MKDLPGVAIIGAGLTGLTAAYYLRKSGFAVNVFEKSDHPGGVIQTFTENGFVYEAGPNTGVLGHPEAMELIEELRPDCEIEIADASAKARWIWKENRWEPLPTGLWSAIKTPLFTLGDKLRILGEPFRKKGNNPEETLAQMVRRRLGKSFLEYAVDPFILGIYAGDPNYLVAKYALPKLYYLEQNYGSFIKGAFRKAKEPKNERDKKATREIFSVKGGLQNLITALVKHAGTENIHLSSGNIVVNPQPGGGFHLETAKGTYTNFDYVISTVGAHSLASLMPFLGSYDLENICCLKYARVVQVSLGFKKWEGIPLNSFGGLVPFEEHRDILGALFISSFLKGRAPEGGALLSVFLGGLRRPELTGLNDNDITALVKQEIQTMMKLDTFAPDLLKIHHYDHAIPQYGPESSAKIETIELIQKEFPGLFLAGNIRDGIGMADRIRQGRMVANQITGELT